jgi:nucleoside-diphosphate-sugar epimerase
MRVLVAGATSTLGRPVVTELRVRGHDPVALTRSASKAAELGRLGAESAIADVLDADRLAQVVDEASPEAVVSLLIALPPRGPMRMSHFRKTVRLWSRGAPNLLRAAAAAGARRLVCESVIFAYGYARHGARLIDETHPAEGGDVIRGQRAVLDALRGMERQVLEAQRTLGLEGIVLRYGTFHGRDVPSSAFMERMLRRRLLALPGGGRALLSWIEIGDAARATVDALERGRSGEIYNVVDDEPVRFGDYARALAYELGAAAPRSVPMWLSRLAVPYAATILGHTELRVSNAKAKEELGWTPEASTYREVVRQIARG